MFFKQAKLINTLSTFSDMKLLVPLMLLFIVVNIAIIAGGLAKVESPEAKALMSGYHAHFMAFFVLAFVMSLTLLRLKVHHAYLISFSYAVGFALILEVLQLISGYRVFSWLDVLFGALGAGLHWLVAWHFGKGIDYGI
jgi:glycopeptide antibiotics resistance protein